MLKTTLKEILFDHVKNEIFNGRKPDEIFKEMEEVTLCVQKDIQKTIKNLKL